MIVHFECSLASSTSRTNVNMTLEALDDSSSVLTQRMVNCSPGMIKFDDLQLQCGKTYLVSAALPEVHDQCILSTYNITFDQCSGKHSLIRRITNSEQNCAILMKFELFF